MLIAAALVLFGTRQVASCCPTMNDFLADPAFLAVHLRPLPMKFRSKEGKTVTFTDAAGHQVGGYFVPGKAGNHSAVVMVHEFWGLNDHIKQEAVSLHDEAGYAVLAVDLYGGKVSDNAQTASEYMSQVKPEEATAAVEGAVKVLKDGTLAKAAKIGTIGWCFGGGWSLQAAIHGGSAVQACVMYYGMPDTDQSRLAMLKAPVLMVEALKDKWINPEVVGKFKTAMAEAHKSLRVETYDADHGFANPSNPRFQKADTDDAKAKTLHFFHQHLG